MRPRPLTRDRGLPPGLLLAAALLVALGVAACVPAQLASPAAPPVAAVPARLTTDLLTPTPHQSDVSRALSTRLQRAHYLRLELDDELSARLLDKYLEFLDPGRAVLIASDVQQFAAYDHSLDDALREGDLQPAFQIYNRLLERQIARLDWVIELLEAEGFPDSADLPYGPDQELLVDRSEGDWASSTAELDDYWRRRLSAQLIDAELGGRSVEEAAERLLERYTDQRRRTSQTTAEDAFMVFMNALTSSYDPHTQYLVPRQAENFDMRMSLSFQGIGALLRPDGEYALVERLIPAGPAEKAGELMAGDRIVGVGQDTDGPIVDVVGWRLDDVVELIRGERGSTVRLSLLPADAPEGSPRVTISIVRDEVKLEEQSASKEIVELDHDGRPLRLGVVDLPTFYMDMAAHGRGETDFKSATRDVERLLVELREEGVDGVILDLRGNGGGSLIEAHELAGLLLGRRPVVQVRNAEGEVQVLRGAGKAVWDGPLVVLVDRLSASASEIVAAAVQDYGRGLVVGQRSFGKGTVQSVLPAADGRLLMTIAKFYRATGVATQNLGVLPDVQLPATHDTEAIGESTLDGALPWDKIQAQRMLRRNQIPMLQVLPEVRQRHKARAAGDPDLLRLEQEVALLEEVRADPTVTLDLEARRAEQQRYRERREAILAEWRAAKGLPDPETTKTDDEPPDDPQADQADGAEPTSTRRTPRVDPWRQAATQILADLIELLPDYRQK